MRRRDLLVGAAGAAALARMPARAAASSSAPVRIVIAGAGAAGLALASRLRRQLDRATIIIVDAKREHHFQPASR